MAARKFQPQMATGNDLLEGDVVYFTSTGEWSRAIGDAALAVNPEAAAELLKRAEAFPNQVVGVYLVEAAVEKLFGLTLFLDSPTPKRLSAWRNKAQQAAADRAGYAFQPYAQAKVAGSSRPWPRSSLPPRRNCCCPMPSRSRTGSAASSTSVGCFRSPIRAEESARARWTSSARTTSRSASAACA